MLIQALFGSSLAVLIAVLTTRLSTTQKGSNGGIYLTLISSTGALLTCYDILGAQESDDLPSVVLIPKGQIVIKISRQIHISCNTIKNQLNSCLPCAKRSDKRHAQLLLFNQHGGIGESWEGRAARNWAVKKWQKARRNHYKMMSPFNVEGVRDDAGCWISRRVWWWDVTILS